MTIFTALKTFDIAKYPGTLGCFIFKISHSQDNIQFFFFHT